MKVALGPLLATSSSFLPVKQVVQGHSQVLWEALKQSLSFILPARDLPASQTQRPDCFVLVCLL